MPGHLTDEWISLGLANGATRKVTILNDVLRRFVAVDWHTTRLLAVYQGGSPDLHRLADALISLACLTVACYLVFHYLCPWRRRKVPYCAIVWLLAGFLGFSGISQLLNAAVVSSAQGMADIASLALATGSWSTLLVLALMVRKVEAVRDPEDFEKEIAERQRVQTALEKSETTSRKLALVASGTDNAVVITDDHARIEWVNEAFTRITGYSLAEAVGHSPGSLLQGEETDHASVDLMRQRIRAGEGFQTELINYTKSGRKYWVAIDVQPIRDELGRLTNFIAIEIDITGRKRDERRLEAQNATMQVLASSNRLEEAIPRLLVTIGQTLDFDAGEFWTVDHLAQALQLESCPWASPRVSPAWIDGSVGLRLSRDIGLAGRVWSGRCSAWIPDLREEQGEDLIRRELAVASGLRSAFSFPVMACQAGPILGVMTFLSREPLQCDDALLRAMTTLGRQIGLFAERRRAEAELKRVNAQLNAVLDASTQVAIIATDPEGLITVFNSGAQRMLGYLAEEMVGKTTPELIHEPAEITAHAAGLTREFGTNVEGVGALFERARRVGHDVGEWTYIRKDGTRLTVLLAVTAVFDVEGQICGFLGIATDLTDRQRAESRLRSSESRFRRLVESNLLGVAFGDIYGHITDANDAFLEMVGYSRSEMVDGRLPWVALLPEFHTPQLLRCRIELKRRGRCNPFELDCLQKDGKSLPVLVGVALLDESTPVQPGAQVVAFCLDVSERRRLEDQLRQHASELAEANARKNEFLAMLGHELRNPLAPIRNAVKIMKQRDFDDPTLRWAREVIDYQMRQMAQLVDDLLEISRVTLGKVRLQRERVDVAIIIAYAVETSRPILDAHRHHLSISLPPEPVFVHADQVRLAQVLSNLLHNAAKYTDDGGQIRLAVRVEGTDVVIRVRDNGIGIPAEMLSSVFDVFTQVDCSLDRTQGGLGLGLTLVRSLVEMHGGTVSAHSEGPGKGSEFVVVLPQPVEEPRDDSQTPDEPPRLELPGDRPAATARRLDPSPCSVLVVDDNVISAQSLEMLLSLEGHRVQVVHDGPDALKAIQRKTFDVVFMDIGLPGMSGYDVARAVRHQGGLEHLLLVAVTGYAEDEARQRSREAGFDHHLVKPVDPDIILALLSSLQWAGDQADATAGATDRADDSEAFRSAIPPGTPYLLP
jgi:PAS domain S-box-containing protein